MSEYQHYEWRTIDRRLTAAERAAVNELSSHIEVSSSDAWVDYEWGDFKHDPLEVLARYFDAFLYYANWGAQQLAFRFPQNLLDAERLQPYLWAECAELARVGDDYILSIAAPDQDLPDWEELACDLEELLSLRDDILQGDLRLLYLVWLLGAGVYGGLGEMDTEEESDLEPPLPPGLDQLSPALTAFINFMGIDPFLVQAAAQDNASPAMPEQPDLAHALDLLPSAERDDFLRRLLQGEANLQLELRRRLREVMQPAAAPAPLAAPRTFASLATAADELRRSTGRRRR
ncbi:hypothetical protein [Caldilinea sp.]|uniref:hypothetical protein n=1 Tax=Caldilinea sp. TaxID=2293560 RepID=UPI002C07FD05|nr:hypothetical protein [Caldilinea sp.]HRA67733.1 hypothetical protein [Caldilinea sp.]